MTTFRHNDHDWHYPHSIWEGRKGRENEVAVARYCGKCEKKQMAYANLWGNIPSHHDAREECTETRRKPEGDKHRN